MDPGMTYTMISATNSRKLIGDVNSPCETNPTCFFAVCSVQPATFSGNISHRTQQNFKKKRQLKVYSDFMHDPSGNGRSQQLPEQIMNPATPADTFSREFSRTDR
ncbi:hypothetical protein OIU77_023636 [Salix suchowensis]|uniref:Uncharacterized protein n=1 Tax=Salix suchowensis TaxID=1278906 RepID=A0ABQ9C7W0_9ROSI|nr:hypothetical protein OIU77_023636 [Salix suchowensis]